MGILRDFWNYLQYKEKVVRAYKSSEGLLGELNWRCTGPLVFLLISTPFVIWVNVILPWRAMVLPTSFYILIVVMILHDFNKNFRKFKNKTKIMSNTYIRSKVEHIFIKQKSKGIFFVIIFLIIVLVFSYHDIYLLGFFSVLLVLSLVFYFYYKKNNR